MAVFNDFSPYLRYGALLEQLILSGLSTSAGLMTKASGSLTDRYDKSQPVLPSQLATFSPLIDRQILHW
jgi:hypothetical protein